MNQLAYDMDKSSLSERDICTFSANGDGFLFHDRTGASAETETTLGLNAFPSPADLWARYRAWKGLTPEAEEIVLQDYFDDGSGKARGYGPADG